MIDVTVHANQPVGEISPMLYGQMVEHAYWSVHQGLCAQMLDNGGFEPDRDRHFMKVAQRWKLVSTHPDNRFYARVDDENPYREGHCQKIRVQAHAGGTVRLLQNDMSVEAGKAYKGFVLLRGNCKRVSVKLLSVTGRVLDACPVELGSNWEKKEFLLRSDTDDYCAAFAIDMEGEGELYADQAFLYPEDCYGGVREDMAELYRELKPPFVRWPGGSYLIWHRWKEGIGPLEDRPYNDGRNLNDVNFGVYHDGEWDSNAFGTDEFIAFCRKIDSEPMVNINIKEGLQSALEWIEYCNGDVDTHWGAKRAANGHSEPYHVKYWVIDNEPLVHQDQKGYSTETFPIDTAVWAKAMKEKDPSISVMCMGDHDLYNYVYTEPVFSEKVVEAARDSIDHLCVHIYYDETVTGPLKGMPYQMGEAFGRLKTMIDRHCPDRDVKVFLSEWNPHSNANVGGNMGQALEAAQMFHIMERASAAGWMDYATPCQLCVNVDRYRGFWLRGAPVQINNHEAWTSPFYHVNRMYAQLHQPKLLAAEINGVPKRQSPAFDGYTFPAVDIVASGSGDGKKLLLKVVNNSDTEDYEVTFRLEGMGDAPACTIHTVSAPDILTMNSQFTPDTVREHTDSYPIQNGVIQYTAHRNCVAALEISAN